VIAHTLPERDASNRVLEKAGFRYAAATTERGRQVWRFERLRSRG
jgi:[ribosomal protein S5]-alanine N-acetyltransferase